MDGYDGGVGGYQPSTSGDTASVFISNLQWWTTDVDIETACAPYGQVTGVRFIEDRSCGKSRGMVVVDFADATSVPQCIEGLNGRDINGRPCKVARQIQRPGPGGPPGGPGQMAMPGRGMPGRGGGGMMGGRGGRGGRGMDHQDQMMGGGMDPSMMGGGPPMWGMMPPPPGMMMGMMPPGMTGMGMAGGQFRPPPPPGPH